MKAEPRTATIVVAASDSVDTSSADYVCDGTADDVQIQAALSAVPATGGRVLLLEGTYNISAQMTIASSGTTISGQGAGTILKTSGSMNSGYCFYATGKDNITIENMKITLTADLYPDGTIWLDGSDKSTIRGCWLNFGASFQVYLTGSSDVTVINCYIADSDTLIRAISCAGGRIVGNYLYDALVGMQIKDSLSFTVSANTIDEVGDEGLLIDNTGRSAFVGNVVTNSSSGGLVNVNSPDRVTEVANTLNGGLTGATTNSEVVHNVLT